MAENQNKLKGNGSKKPVVITLLIIGLIFWVLIPYGTYAYLCYGYSLIQTLVLPPELQRPVSLPM